jgi:hypothetical protein
MFGEREMTMKNNTMIGKYVVVRTHSAGVHVGVLKSKEGKEVVLTEARRVWYWIGAFTLSAVSQTGVGSESKISIAVPEIMLTEAIEIIPCSNAAEKKLRRIKAYAE